MQCPTCTVENPENNKFCGNCGGSFDAAGIKLRQQIIQIVEREFTDQDLAAVAISDKAEDRLWRWGKLLGLACAILGIAGTVFLAGLAFFGFTTLKQAKQTTIAGLNQTANQSKEQIDAKGAEIISRMQQAEKLSVSTIEDQSKTAGREVAAVVSRAKLNNGQLQSTEANVKVLQTRLVSLQGDMDALANLRKQLPNTPIGNVDNKLFESSGFGVGPYGSNSFGGITPSSSYLPTTGQAFPALRSPYREGTIGSGVTALQTRLSQLKCFSDLPSGFFDAKTAEAVSEFVRINGRVSPNSASLLNASSDSPALLIEDKSDGAVDYVVWAEIFDPTAKSCR